MFLVEPIEFLFPLEDQTVREIPGTAQFQTEITKRDVTATWRKGSDVIGPNEKYEISAVQGVHKLIVNDVTGEDECDYSATFRDVTTSAKLHVCGKRMKCKNIVIYHVNYTHLLCFVFLAPPKFLTSEFNETVTIKAGNLKIFEIPFSSNPQPEV